MQLFWADISPDACINSITDLFHTGPTSAMQSSPRLLKMDIKKQGIVVIFGLTKNSFPHWNKNLMVNDFYWLQQ